MFLDHGGMFHNISIHSNFSGKPSVSKLPKFYDLKCGDIPADAIIVACLTEELWCDNSSVKKRPKLT